MPKKLTQEEFIARAAAVHGASYDYSQTVYLPAPHKMLILCLKHGPFEQSAKSHMLGNGCGICGREATIKGISYTQEDFLNKAQASHGTRYDYSQVVYINSQTKVKILCPKHGVFEQKPNSHMIGNGCAKCGGVAKLCTEVFINKASATHGNQYDYSRVAYVNTKSKVVIGCSVHGWFEQGAKDHISGKGCRRCAIVRVHAQQRNTLADFLIRAHMAHNSTYDYKLVTHQGSKVKVKIICSIHGVFKQAPYEHLAGKGCPTCGFARIVATRTLTTEEFVARARKTHGERFNYALTAYIRDKDKVEISCPVHGSFKQLPSNHLTGAGCQKCGLAARVAKRKKIEAEYLAEVALTHKHKYDYSRVVMGVNNKAKIEIMCPTHGGFLQQALSHSQGQGCPKCALEIARQHWAERAAGRLGTLYFIRIFTENEEFYKVGITLDSVEQRYRAKRSLGSYRFEVLAIYKSRNAVAVWEWEQSILETFAHLSYRPRHIFIGHTECFSSCDEILALFPL
jgi:hypothetical protein